MKFFKLSIKNIIYGLICFVMYFFITFNIIVSIIFALTTLYVIDIYILKKAKLKKRLFTEFQINSFIKNFSITSLTNNFNVLDSLKKSITYSNIEFKTDIEICITEIEADYNYGIAFKKLAKKYEHNRVFIEFLNNLLIVKEQSNIESSAKQIYAQASLDSQKYIVHLDKKVSLKEEQFKNYLINTGIGLSVIYLVIISLNAYYIEYAKSLEGVVLNSSAIVASLFVTIWLINKTFEVDNEE